VEPRTVDVHVTRLRRKLQVHSGPPTILIETVWGVGYRLRNSHVSSDIAAHAPAGSVSGVSTGRLRLTMDPSGGKDGSGDLT
jgi:DNA-binding winged helix-turn-helix (wHTH) protein